MRRHKEWLWMAVLLTAGMICFGQTDAQRAAGPLMGLRAVEEPLPWLDLERRYAALDRRIRDKAPDQAVAVTSLGRPPMHAPLSVRLSRFLYPAEDEHLDAIVRFDMDLGQTPEGSLGIVLADAEGNAVSRAVVENIVGSQLHFSYRFPPEMAGGAGELRLTWQRPAGDAEASAAFEVAPPAEPPRSGRVRLTVPNDAGATVRSAPATVGVPFPRGALDSVENLRLVDGQGVEIPLQIKENARWSRFGSVKWIHADFVLDLDGGAREVFLEYGPEVSRAPRPDLAVSPSVGAFPTVETGRLRLGGDGVSFDAAGDGNFRQVLGHEALAGAFVEKLDGVHAAHHRLTEAPRYAMPADVRYEVEESGPEKAVLRAEGWLVHEESGKRFCQLVNRYVVHRDSPVLRIFHTWIYTGDDKKDFIRNMGWRFPLEGLRPVGFLSDFGEGGEWLVGGYLRQHAHDEFGVFEVEEHGPHSRLPEHLGYEPVRPLRELAAGRRAPGVMAAEGDGVRLYVGVRDFWQNSPNSLKAEEGALTFYQWPRFGKPRENPPTPDDIGNVWRHAFVHEGENLSFQLPRELTEGPIYFAEAGREPHFAYGRPDSVNAQGIAKTAEMWVYLTDAGTPAEEAAKVLRGLNDESLRAVVEPRWVAGSGAFFEIAAKDVEAWPEYERAYAENARSPLRQVERMGLYGKWLYGDILRSPDLDNQTAGLYRTFRKSHWGWPYSWIPFARSGELDFLRFSQAATRMMTDIAFCHYVGEDVERYFEELPKRRMWAPLQPFRAIGWNNRNLIPWAGYWGPSTRCYVDKACYLWHAWHLTGYHRARDVAMRWAEQTKIEDTSGRIMRGPILIVPNRQRWPANLIKHYLEMYENTFDPWFLAGAQAIADLHAWRHREEGWAGHFWQASTIAYYRYTRCPQFKAYFDDHIAAFTDIHYGGYARQDIPQNAFAYHLTGDEYYLRRLAGALDHLRWAHFDQEEPWYYRGFFVRTPRVGQDNILATSYLHQWVPLAFGAFAEAGEAPSRPIPMSFEQWMEDRATVAVRKSPGVELTLRTGGAYVITGPDGERHAEGDAPEAVLDADAPAGTYRVALPGRRRRVRLPITPPDVPEVLVPSEGAAVGTGGDYAQHWFMVPEGTESFWIEFENPPLWRQAMRQNIVWDPDGNEAWAHREWDVDHDPERQTIRADIEVGPGQSGRLWRVTLPGQRSVPFLLAPNLPQALAHDPERWFDPQADAGGHVIRVTDEGHRSGEYTLQAVFNDLPKEGGTVLLGEGEFEVVNVAVPEGKPVRLAGQGAATVIRGPGNRRSLTFNPTPYLEVTDLTFTGQLQAVVLSDGAYGHVKFHRVRFHDIARTAIAGGVTGPVDRITVTECQFENLRIAAGFRNRVSRNMTVSDNRFTNIAHRAIIVGAKGGDNRSAEIKNNTIVNMEQPDARTHVIGILSYVDETLMENNTIKNAYSDRRHEAISSRGANSVLRNNRIVNAGGSTAAISLAGRSPTVIENNVIRFTDEHKGRFDGIDIRQRTVRVVGNEITGSRVAIHARRGVTGMEIENNLIANSSRQTEAIRITISTGAVIPEDGMADLTIRGNTISGISKGEGEGRFTGILFHIWNHRGEHDTRMDDVIVEGNVFKEIDVADGSDGVDFRGLERDDSHMRNVRIADNDFGAVDVPITEAKRLVEELQVQD